MQPSRRHGRDFLIKQLSKVEAPIRDAVVRHLFERNDHISTSAVDITAVYRDRELELQKSCASWTSNATEMLDQLCQDMHLALRITNWDRNILEDTLTLIDFLLDCFGAWEDLIKACAKRPNKNHSVGGEPPRRYPTFGKDLKQSLGRAKNQRTDLVAYWTMENPSTREYVNDLINNSRDSKIVKIPTATLRELFILNEAYGMREKIWYHVDVMLQSHEKDEASTTSHSKELTHVICMPAILCL